MRKTKVLSFGPGPNFDYVETNLDALVAVGFDGYVLAPTYEIASVENYIYTKIWGPDVIPWGSIPALWNGVSPIPSNALEYNFLRANCQPGGIDWFDTVGMANITANMVGITTLAKNSLCKGVMFDNETYDAQIWQYSTQPQVGLHTLNEYKTQVYNYAYALGLLLWPIFPDCVFFNTLNYWASYGSADPESIRQYGLLPSFFDGLLDSMAEFPCVRFIQGNEFSYACKAPDTACWTYGVAHSAVGIYRGSSPQYNRHGRIAFATYGTRPPYDNVVTSGNYFTPTDLTDTLEFAAPYTDQYLWVYTGEYRWIDPAPSLGTSYRISPDYDDSILNALPNLP